MEGCIEGIEAAISGVDDADGDTDIVFSATTTSLIHDSLTVYFLIVEEHILQLHLAEEVAVSSSYPGHPVLIPLTNTHIDIHTHLFTRIQIHTRSNFALFHLSNTQSPIHTPASSSLQADTHQARLLQSLTAWLIHTPSPLYPPNGSRCLAFSPSYQI